MLYNKSKMDTRHCSIVKLIPPWAMIPSQEKSFLPFHSTGKITPVLLPLEVITPSFSLYCDLFILHMGPYP